MTGKGWLQRGGGDDTVCSLGVLQEMPLFGPETIFLGSLGGAQMSGSTGVGRRYHGRGGVG